MAVSAGIPPHVLAGEEPVPAGQEWDEVDVALVRAWGDLQENLCGKCGRPRDMHSEDDVAEYTPAHHTCTAARALDDFLTKWAKCDHSLPAAALAEARRDRSLREAGYHPDGAREWFTRHKSETPSS